MEVVFGTILPVFSVAEKVLIGGAAFMTGQAAAATWRPVGLLLFYVVLLGLTDRFLTWGLFQGELLSITGFVVDTAALAAIALFTFRVTRVSKMVSQYPWLYERVGPMHYRERPFPTEK